MYGGIKVFEGQPVSRYDPRIAFDIQVCSFLGYPKRDHTLDNLPFAVLRLALERETIQDSGVRKFVKKGCRGIDSFWRSSVPNQCQLKNIKKLCESHEHPPYELFPKLPEAGLFRGLHKGSIIGAIKGRY